MYLELEVAGIAERSMRVKENKWPRITPGFLLGNWMGGGEIHSGRKHRRQSKVFKDRGGVGL